MGNLKNKKNPGNRRTHATQLKKQSAGIWSKSLGSILIGRNFRSTKMLRCGFLCVQIDFLLDTWTDLDETFGVYTVGSGVLHRVLFHFRSEPQNRKLAILPWNQLYFGIKFYREWQKSDFELIGSPYDIGETGNTGSFRKFQFMTSHIQYTYRLTPNFISDSMESKFLKFTHANFSGFSNFSFLTFWAILSHF